MLNGDFLQIKTYRGILMPDIYTPDSQDVKQWFLIFNKADNRNCFIIGNSQGINPGFKKINLKDMVC